MKYLALLLAPAALFAGQARYARLGPFEGPVEVQLSAADAWTPAELNLPLPQGAWLRTGADARLEMELDDGSALRLGADSQAELSDYASLSTGQRVTLLSLDHGIAWFTRAAGVPDAAILVMPGMQIALARAARVRIECDAASSQVSVLEGTVRFSSPAAEIDLQQGQTSRVEPSHPNRFFLDRAIAANDLDRWSGARDKLLATPVSAGHVMEHYGLADLDTAGHWLQTDQFGAVWKPAVAADWAPFQNGRWVWYDTLGYTWVSADAWGWLPYHYGRWARTADQGWIWAPSVSQIFKPGEVFWMRGDKFAGWGPLAPGEQWTPPEQPRQFVNANLTWAAFQPDAAAIDPAGFSARPKEPLSVATFAVALPSPALPASRLDATRPLTRAGSTRIEPVVPGVTFENPETAAQPEPKPAIPPAPRPIVIVAPPSPPAEPDAVAIPVPVAVPVLIAGIMTVPHAGGKAGAPAKALPTPAPPTPKPVKPLPQPHPPGRRPRDNGETEIYNQVLKDEAAPAKQLQDLETWSRRYPDSDFQNDRTVLYLQAYAKTGQAARVVQMGTELMRRQPLQAAFDDAAAAPVQILNVLYLMVKNGHAAETLNAEQRRGVQRAAHELLAYTPTFFAPARKPANVSEADWRQIREYMDGMARSSIQRGR